MDKEQTDAELDAELTKDLPDGGSGIEVKDEQDKQEEEDEGTKGGGDIPPKPDEEKSQIEPDIEPSADSVSGDSGDEPKAGKDVQSADTGGAGERTGDPVGGGAGDDATANNPKRNGKSGALAGGGAGVGKPQPDPLIAELSDLTAKIESDEFDPYSKEGKQALMRRQDVSARIEATSAASSVSQWDDLSEQFGQPKSVLKSVWNEEIIKAQKRFGVNTEAAAAVASVEFDRRMAELNKPSVKPPKSAPTPITAKGGRVAPPSARAVPPQPKELNEEEELVQNVSRATTKVLGKR